MADAEAAVAESMASVMKNLNVLDEKINTIAEVHMRLAETLERFLKSRATN